MGKFPLQAIFSSFRFWENWKNSACEGTQAVLAITSKRKFLVLADCKKRQKIF